MASWLAMAAAEVDGYRVDSNPNGIGSYAKYSVSERKAMREKVRLNNLLTPINNLLTPSPI